MDLSAVYHGARGAGSTLTSLSWSSHSSGELLVDENTRNFADISAPPPVPPPRHVRISASSRDQGSAARAVGGEVMTIGADQDTNSNPNADPNRNNNADTSSGNDAYWSMASETATTAPSRRLAPFSSTGHDNAASQSLDKALTESELSNAMLLWPSAVRGSCKTTTGVPASPSTESPAKRGRSSRAGSSVVGTSPPPLSPKATSRSSFGDDYDRVDTPTAAAIKRGPPISPPSPFHLFAGTQLSPISKNCDLHHNSVDLQAAAGATSTHRPLCLKPLPFPRAMMMAAYDDGDEHNSRGDPTLPALSMKPTAGGQGEGKGDFQGKHKGRGFAGVGDDENRGESADRQGERPSRADAGSGSECAVVRCRSGDGDLRENRWTLGEKHNSSGDSGGSGGNGDNTGRGDGMGNALGNERELLNAARNRPPSPELLCTILSPPTLPGSDTMDLCENACDRVSTASPGGDTGQPSGSDGDAGGGGSGGEGTDKCNKKSSAQSEEEDVEVHRVDLCDPAWSLNPVLAPMPMPDDDEVDANDENVNDGSGGGNDDSPRRRRGLSGGGGGGGGSSSGHSDMGGRLVAVAAVNPEAQTAPVASNASFGIGSLFPEHRAPVTDNNAGAVFGTGGDVSSDGKSSNGLEQNNANASRGSTISRSKSKNSRSTSNKRRYLAASDAMPASAAAELLHPSAEGVLADTAAETPATPKNKRNAADPRGIGAVAGSGGRSGGSRRGGQGGLCDGSPIRKVARYGSGDARGGLSSARVDTGDTMIANADLAFSTGGGTRRENVGSQNLNVVVGVPGEQSQALAVSAADACGSTVDATARFTATVNRDTPLVNGSGLISSSEIASSSPASPVNVSAATAVAAVGVTTAVLPAAATPTATYSGGHNSKYPGAAASTPAPPPAAELPAVRADRGGRVHHSHHDNAHQPLVSSGATDLVAANKDVRESGGRKGSGGNGGIASGEDSGHASCGGSAAEGRRPRPAGKALTKEMFGSPAQGGGVADASNAVYCEGTTGSLNEGDVGVTAAVEVANGDSLPGPAIMAELSKSAPDLSGGGRKYEKVARAPCTCKKCRCLKLYCDCFASSRFCGTACLCKGCHNTPDQEGLRAARRSTLERNPGAFQRLMKLGGDRSTVVDGAGCRCSRSQCIKKYCICFNQGLPCGDACNCKGCKNKVGTRSYNKHMARNSININNGRHISISSPQLPHPQQQNHLYHGQHLQGLHEEAPPPQSQSQAHTLARQQQSYSHHTPGGTTSSTSAPTLPTMAAAAAVPSMFTHQEGGLSTPSWRTVVSTQNDQTTSSSRLLSRASHANGGVGGEVPGGQGGDGDLRIDRSLPMRQAAAAAAEAAAAASLGRGSTPQVWSSSLLSPPPTPSERLQRLYYPCDEDEDGIDDGSHMDVLNSNGNGKYNDGNESAGYRDVGGGGAGVTAGQSGSGSSVGGVDGLSVANAQGDLALPPRTRSAPPLPMLPASHAGTGLLRGGCSADGGGVGCGETRAASGGPGAVPGVAVGGGGVVPFRRRKVVLQDAADEFIPSEPVFGPECRRLKKRCADLSFSFLDNDDLYNASLVSSTWSLLAMGSALWEEAN